MQTERVFREMPDFSENATMGLSNKARSHLVVYNANIGTILRPLVMEMIDVHGEAAQELIEKMKRHGNHVKVFAYWTGICSVRPN